MVSIYTSPVTAHAHPSFIVVRQARQALIGSAGLVPGEVEWGCAPGGREAKTVTGFA